jgi:hypothetical protein
MERNIDKAKAEPTLTNLTQKSHSKKAEKMFLI